MGSSIRQWVRQFLAGFVSSSQFVNGFVNSSMGSSIRQWVRQFVSGFVNGFVNSSMGSSIRQWVRQFVNGFVNSSMGSSIRQWVRQFVNGFVNSSMGSSIRQWVRQFVSGFVNSSMGSSLRQWVRQSVNGFVNSSMGSSIRQWVRQFVNGFVNSSVGSSIRQWVRQFVNGCNANTFLTLHIELFTPHSPHFTLALHLNSSHQCLFCLASHRNWFIFASNTIEATSLYFRIKQNSEPSAMQTMHLFHLTLNPWQQSCLDHTARTGTRAIAVSVLYAPASAMQQQIVFVQTTYLKNKSGVTWSPFTGPFLRNQVPPQEHMQDSNSQRGEGHAQLCSDFPG